MTKSTICEKSECFAYYPGDLTMWSTRLLTLASIQQVRPNECSKKEFLIFLWRLLENPLIWDHWSFISITSFPMKCRIGLIPVQHYRHTPHTYFLISPYLCFRHRWVYDAITMFCDVGSNISTFLFLDDDLLKYLMICDNFLHLLWILVETICWVMYWLWIK